MVFGWGGTTQRLSIYHVSQTNEMRWVLGIALGFQGVFSGPDFDVVVTRYFDVLPPDFDMF